jgi:succinate dehydrogenase / fumarate reductase membrane anchor subunit
MSGSHKYVGTNRGVEGAATFWMQRLTSVALIPLTIWFLVALIRITSAPYLTAADFMARPFNAIVFLLFIWAAVVHMKIGVMEIVDEYIHSEALKITIKLLNTCFAVTIGVTCAFAVLKISFGG